MDFGSILSAAQKNAKNINVSAEVSEKKQKLNAIVSLKFRLIDEVTE